jgi:dephospho-CoA kinase
MLVGIIGPSCAGKTTAGEFLKSKTCSKFHEASDHVHQRFDRSSNYQDVMTFVTQIFETGQKDFVARSLFEKISPIRTGELHIVAGLRTVEELNLLANHFSESYLLGIQAGASTRYDRYVERERDDKTLRYEEFLQKDAQEYSFGIAEMLATRTDGFIVNEGCFNAFYDDLEKELACIREKMH